MKFSSKVLAHIGAEVGRSALLVLADRHPDLIVEIEQIVHANAAATTFQDVADRVVAALAELSMFDLGRRDAADPLGYRDETETAWDVVTETIQPFIEAIHRQAKMGLTAVALVYCEGTLLGLYRADREQVSELLEWIPDGLSELTAEPLRALAPVRRRTLPGSKLTACTSLKQIARKHLPEWTWLQK